MSSYSSRPLSRSRSLGLYALVALASIVIGIAENVFFGADTGGAKHYISVGFFFLQVAGLLALVVIGVVALVRWARTSRASS